MTLDRAETLEALKHYGFHVPAENGSVPQGSAIGIAGRTNAAGEKFVALHGANTYVEGRIPLSPGDVEQLVANSRAYHHLPHEKVRRMLTHLVEHAAGFLAEDAIERFWIKATLHDDAYTVTGASVAISKPLHLRPRLGPHAHDMKGNFKPSGKQ
jgi:hypothetical protein